MADENQTDTKEKRTVPAMTRSARGVADHAAAVLEMQWDKERRAFKDPVTVMMALFTYTKLTAALLDEAESRLAARATAVEVRLEKLEQQFAAFESWRADAERQGAEMAKGFEDLMAGGDPMSKLKEAIAAYHEPAIAEAPPLPTEAEPAAVVVPLKPEKAEKRDSKREEKKGGAA
jgi:hypothetical protein